VSGRIVLAATILFFIGLAPVGTPVVELAPLSLVTVVPALLAGPIAGSCGALIAPLVFVALSRPILAGRTIPSKGTIWAFMVLVVLACTIAVLGWNDTLHTSIRRAAALSIQALVPPLILIAIFRVSGNRLTIRGSVTLHWCALAWFTWSAFPWWGELL
jgi:hypothetical protein